MKDTKRVVYKDFTPETVNAINTERDRCWNSFYTSLITSGGNPAAAVINIFSNPDTYRIIGTDDNGIKFNNFHIKNEDKYGQSILSGHYDTYDVTGGNPGTIIEHLVIETIPALKHKYPVLSPAIELIYGE